MAFSMAGGGPSRPEINVTPLIDVLLVLIIVFMVVVAMDKEYVEKAQIPQPDQKQTAEPAIAHYRDPDRRSEEHTSELQSRVDLVCRLLLEKKKKKNKIIELTIHIRS